jgi:hypothetical protein
MLALFVRSVHTRNCLEEILLRYNVIWHYQKVIVYLACFAGMCGLQRIVVLQSIVIFLPRLR